jgi:NADH dehydrogenase
MILVVGSTGCLGSRITKRLLAVGHPVRILVRPNAEYAPLVKAGAVPIFGDLKDPTSLPVALTGVDTVITTAKAMFNAADTIETVDRQGNRHLIDAAKAAGVRHFILGSTLLADRHSLVPFIQAKGETEEYLKQSGIPYTILAPNAFFEVWMAAVIAGPALIGQPVTLVGEGRRQHSFVSADDVAAYAVAAVQHPAMNIRIPIGGPEIISWRDAVATFERVWGRPIPIQTVALGERVPGLPDLMQPLFAAFETFDSPLDMTESQRRYGVTPTTLETWVRYAYPAAALPALPALPHEMVTA